MPVKFGLWRVDGESVEHVPTSGIASEERLEDILEARIDILGLGNLFQIGRQVVTDFGKRIDPCARPATSSSSRRRYCVGRGSRAGPLTSPTMSSESAPSHQMSPSKEGDSTWVS